MTDNIEENSETTRINRRMYLTTLGALVAVPAGVAQSARAEEEGYGAGGYSEGPYGETTTDDGEPDVVPEITTLTAEDTSNPRNPHVDVVIEWQASITEGELGAAELELSGADGELGSWEYDLTGQTAERIEETRLKHGSGQGDGSVTYTVELTVYSDHDTVEHASTTFESP